MNTAGAIVFNPVTLGCSAIVVAMLTLTYINGIY